MWLQAVGSPGIVRVNDAASVLRGTPGCHEAQVLATNNGSQNRVVFAETGDHLAVAILSLQQISYIYNWDIVCYKWAVPNG